MTTLKINGKEVKTNGYFATDGKRYFILEDDSDMNKVPKDIYEIIDINELEKDWEEYGKKNNYSYINNWKLTEGYVDQASQRVGKYDEETVYHRDPVVFEGFLKPDTNYEKLVKFLDGRETKIEVKVERLDEEAKVIVNNGKGVKEITTNNRTYDNYYVQALIIKMEREA
ncbi:hypothetical protein [Macrococcoides caseolyticum]|uniref:hypothetical protein n=1 Tax=Macrococcoides caseolyticum TaxID=69966 RepID=UPI0030EDB795